MKLFFCFIIVASFGFVGNSLSNFYKLRKKFFFNLNMFVSDFKLNINFSSKKLLTFIDRFLINVNDKNFSQLLYNFKLNIIQKKSFDFDSLFNNIYILNRQEKESIFQLLSKLGRVNVYSQNDFIEKFLIYCNDYYNSSKNDCLMYSSLYTKLGFVFGVLLVIVLY